MPIPRYPPPPQAILSTSIAGRHQLSALTAAADGNGLYWSEGTMDFQNLEIFGRTESGTGYGSSSFIYLDGFSTSKGGSIAAFITAKRLDWAIFPGFTGAPFRCAKHTRVYELRVKGTALSVRSLTFSAFKGLWFRGPHFDFKFCTLTFIASLTAIAVAAGRALAQPVAENHTVTFNNRFLVVVTPTLVRIGGTGLASGAAYTVTGPIFGAKAFL
ncbi:hypothetical protein MSAN_02267100 [Mycena sanguinolenta]|uniref:Uncharacterized protein n=1 Tax=Mycena sanguinolenta TaxID=230812 RepID=A0A8H7CIP4_9AGAR|nr:hypothetical protein MSAN_02267100 [Mycena sanguinolenta]